MTSMDADSVSTILCTCKQTRFNIQTPNYRELDIEGLNITVAAGASTGTSTTKSGAGKGRSKAKKSDGTEILSNAKLRIKAGERYALVGRNGTGKSTLLKAIAEKLIPGIPEETRIVILQQTNLSDVNTDEVSAEEADASSASVGAGLTVLEEVIERATSKHEVEREISILSGGVESSSAYGALRSIRKVRHERLQREFFLKDKDARLRSGARGWNARKALVTMEKKVAEFAEVCNQEENQISSDDLAKETREAADLLADLQLQVEPDKIAQMEKRAKGILDGLGFSEERIKTPVSRLSGGWKMRCSLAAALLQDRTDLLILDEPTNFLDLRAIMWLERHLESLADGFDPPTLILVSHDRDFISVCTDLILIQDKALTYFHGDLPSYEASQAEKKAHLTKMKEAQDKQKDHIEKTIQRNLREGKQRDDQNKIRQAKSRQAKLDNRWGLETSAKGGRFKLNRDLVGYHLKAREDIDIPQGERPVHLALPPPPDLRFPGSLISLEKVSFRYPLPKGSSRTKSAANNNKLVLQGIDLSVGMGDRIGILGLNGSGKSTLIRLLIGEHDHPPPASGGEKSAARSTPPSPTSGTLETHPRLRLGYYAQHAVERLQQLGNQEPDLTSLALLLREETSSASSAIIPGGGGGGSGGASGEAEATIRASLARLGLPGRLASDVPIRRLSGGQLVRLELARVLSRRPQLLVLDEVTTHLDYDTVRALRRALRDWKGGVVLVTHDRWFMRGVVEGLVDEEEEGEEGGDGESDEGGGEDSDAGVGDAVGKRRRRIVYRLRGGEMKVLSKGTTEFESFLEKKVSKMGVD